MKTILAVMLFGLPMALPMVARADYIDVLEIKLNDACKFDKELQIVRDLVSQWGVKHGYSVELWIPIEAPSPNLGYIYWVGRAKDMTALGSVVDTFAAEAGGDPNSVAGKLHVRLAECEMIMSRSGYVTRK